MASSNLSGDELPGVRQELAIIFLSRMVGFC